MGNTLFCSNYPPYPKNALPGQLIRKQDMNWGFNLAKKFPRSHFQFSWLTATHFFWYNLWEFDVKSNNTCSHLFYISIFSLLCSAWQCIVTVWRRNLLITLGNEKVIDLFLFLVPKQSTLNQKHWKESFSFSSFIYFL